MQPRPPAGLNGPFHRFSVCGQIAILRFPDSAKQMSKYRVVLSSQEKDKALVTVEADAQGSFCFKAKPGTYKVQVQGVLFCLFKGQRFLKALLLANMGLEKEHCHSQLISETFTSQHVTVRRDRQPAHGHAHTSPFSRPALRRGSVSGCRSCLCLPGLLAAIECS